MKERKTELTGAAAFRIKGEANDLLGNFSDALMPMKKIIALSFNPKIGFRDELMLCVKITEIKIKPASITIEKFFGTTCSDYVSIYTKVSSSFKAD